MTGGTVIRPMFKGAFESSRSCFHRIELIADGAIGTPTMIRVKTLVAGKSSSPFQDDLEVEGYIWRFNELSPGGHLFDDVWHKYAAALWLVDDSVRSVQAVVRQGPFFFEAPTAALWEYSRDDLLGMMEVSYAPNMFMRTAYYGADEFFEIQGTHGFLWVTRCTGELLRTELPALLLCREDGSYEDFPDVEVPYEVSHHRSSAAWVDAVRDGTASDLDPEVGLARAARRRTPGEASDRFEGEALAFHRKLRQAYLAIAAGSGRSARRRRSTSIRPTCSSPASSAARR